MTSGIVDAALNVAGTVVNNGVLDVNRRGNLTLNNGANWNQNGSMFIRTTSNTSQGGSLTINPGASFNYTGSSTIGVSPSSGNLGSAKLAIAGGTLVTSRGFQNATAASTGAATILLTNGGTLRLSASIPQLTTGTATNTFIYTGTGSVGGGIDTSTFSTTISNVITGSGSLTKLGAGVLTLAASNTLTGGVTISNGTLLVNGYVGNGTVVVASGASLGGIGTVGGAVAVNGMVAPGASSIGTLSTGAETWNAGGAYQFSLNNATNSSGQDLLSVTGTLNIQSTTNNPFTIRLVSLTSGNTPGLLAGFDSSVSNTWTLAIASAGIQNFDSSRFTVDTITFSNTFTGIFSVGTNASSLLLTYAPASLVPPSTSSPVLTSGGMFMFSFSGPPGQSYHVYSSTNLAAPMSDWLIATSGVFGAAAANYSESPATALQKFFRVASP
jgi:autotransporter-associated beta strand protein